VAPQERRLTKAASTNHGGAIIGAALYFAARGGYLNSRPSMEAQMTATTADHKTALSGAFKDLWAGNIVFKAAVVSVMVGTVALTMLPGAGGKHLAFPTRESMGTAEPSGPMSTNSSTASVERGGSVISAKSIPVSGAPIVAPAASSAQPIIAPPPPAAVAAPISLEGVFKKPAAAPVTVPPPAPAAQAPVTLPTAPPSKP